MQPKIFFTSDWHIGHANVLGFDARPFRDLDHMHKVLINNHNATVSEDATTFFLGDMGLCGAGVLQGIVQALNGRKVLILGNHDKGPSAMAKVGFDVVVYSASLVIAGEPVTMTHCPLRGVFREDVTGMRGSQPGEHWHGETRQQYFSIPSWGQYHLHGHVHKGPEERILGRQFDVGVRANGYRPVALGQIESWIVKGRNKK